VRKLPRIGAISFYAEGHTQDAEFFWSNHRTDSILHPLRPHFQVSVLAHPAALTACWILIARLHASRKMFGIGHGVPLAIALHLAAVNPKYESTA